MTVPPLVVPASTDDGKFFSYNASLGRVVWTVGQSGASASNTQTSTAYTFVLGDAGKTVTGSSTSATTFTVPPNASVAFPVGSMIGVEQHGEGTITLAGGSTGVALRTRDATLSLAGQWAVATLRKINTNEWLVSGDLT